MEPGAFRTDFAGRSLTGTTTPIDDYAETVGPRRKENDAVHGTQPGDPARAAEAIITAVTSSAPPALLLLGTDALGAARQVSDRRLTELEAWAELSASTDLDRDGG